LKKNITLILPTLRPGGAEKIVVIIANLLQRNNEFNVTLLLMNNSNLFFKNELDPMVCLDFIGYKRSIDFLLFPIKFIRKILKYKPDIIFSGYGEINPFIGLFSIFFKKTKFIARETSIPSLRLNKTYLKWMYFKVYTLFDRIIVQSISMKNDLIYNFNISHDKLILIYNPIDSFFLDKLKSNNSSEFFDKENSKLLIYIGTINENKNVCSIISLFNKIKSQKFDAKLLIIGSGPDDKKVNDEIIVSKFSDSIFRIPETNLAPLYLEYADYLVISSNYEGFPNVALEASYFGVPIILSNNTKGGAKEFIVQNINGVIVDFDNTNLDFMHLNFDKDKIREILYSRHSLDIFYNHFVKLLA
jgi:glycosyltransferase involved in cell wall biosynthesis